MNVGHPSWCLQRIGELSTPRCGKTHVSGVRSVGVIVVEETVYFFQHPKMTQQVGCRKKKNQSWNSSEIKLGFRYSWRHLLHKNKSTFCRVQISKNNLTTCPVYFVWATTLQENSNVVRKKKKQQLSDQSSTEDSKYTFNINFLFFISHLIP